MKAYLANGLFSEADIMYNEFLSMTLRELFPDLELFVPQEQEINDKNSYADSVMIANTDTYNLLFSDFMIAVIDGVEIDSGVSCEIGIFSTTGKPIIAICTDIRQQGRDNPHKIEALINDGLENQFIYRNLFTVGVIKKNGKIVNSTNSLIDAIEELHKSNK